jgi:small-conductance mechanosensitive channel
MSRNHPAMKFVAPLRVVIALIVSALLVCAPSSAATTEPGESEVALELAPVKVDGVTLFRLRGATSFPAADRAAAIARRIEAVADDRRIEPASVRTVPDGPSIGIFAGPTRLMLVLDADAAVEQLNVQELAEAYRLRIQTAIVDYRAARSSERITRGAVMAGVATLLFALAVGLLLFVSSRLTRRIQGMMQARVQTVGIQSFEIVRAERIRTVVSALLRIITIVAVAGLSLAWLVIMLRQFPWTFGFGNELLDNVLEPLTTLGRAALAAIPHLIFLVVLYYIVRGVLRLVRTFFVAVERGAVKLSEFEPEWAIPTYKIVRLAIVALGLVVAYPYIPGSDSAAFKGLSLFAGVVFSLGSTTAISNIVAGYMMTYRRAFRVGDIVRIGDVAGAVTAMRLQVTHVRTPKNEEVVIPNSQIINGHVVNYSTLAKKSGLLLHTTVGIGYETPWRQVEAMLLEAAARTMGLAQKPEPFVLQTLLGDFAVTYELNVACDDPRRMPQLYSTLHRNILDVFNEYGVAIMTPAYVADPADAKFVPKDKWYLPPAKPGDA